MTTGLFATFPLAVGHELHLQLGRTRAITLALLATLCVALVTTSAARVDRLVAATASAPSVADLATGKRDPAASRQRSSDRDSDRRLPDE